MAANTLFLEKKATGKKGFFSKYIGTIVQEARSLLLVKLQHLAAIQSNFIRLNLYCKLEYNPKSLIQSIINPH